MQVVDLREHLLELLKRDAGLALKAGELLPLTLEFLEKFVLDIATSREKVVELELNAEPL